MTTIINLLFLLDPFYRIWRRIFITNAETYTGLYSGLLHITNGTAKKPEKILKEWCKRTENQFGECKATYICRRRIMPFAESLDQAGMKKVALKLLRAAEAAEICVTDKMGKLVLTDKNADAYTDLNDNELHVGDTISVISPAWFQKDRIIEKGYCQKQEQ